MDITERDNLIVTWQEKARQLARLKDDEMALRQQVIDACFPDAKVGTNNLDLGKGYTLKGVRKLNYNLTNGQGETERALDAIEKLGNDGQFIAERLVGWTPKLSLTEYKKLEPETNPTHRQIKALIDTVLTITDGAPTLEVVEPKTK